MTKVTKTIIPVTTTIYTWQCPRCQTDMSRSRAPGQDLLCWPCVEAQEAKRFEERFKQLRGAKVLIINPPTELIFDEDVHSITLEDATGQRWLVIGNDGLSVYRVDKRGVIEA